MILVVGATGQIGSAIVQRLAAMGKPVRAFVRASSDYKYLAGPNVEFAVGDLGDPQSIEAAVKGVEVVISTANTVAPSGKYFFEKIEGQGPGGKTVHFPFSPYRYFRQQGLHKPLQTPR